MPRRLSCISLALVLLLSSEVWALGLGEIRLDSALNEPLRAEIELLSASAEELDGLRVALASAETFDRYGIERPAYLQGLNFETVRSGRADGNYVRVTSPVPITEPFLTFLVEATWSRGRLLREYTVLLDPPTYAPPSQAQTPVTAPQRSTPVDSGRIERQPPQAVEQPAPRPARPAPQAAQPAPQQATPARPADDTIPYDTSGGNDYQVVRGDTLWGIAAAIRPDARLTMNQTMLAIFEANPDAFGGNINILRAGATLRIPSADNMYRIDRGYAFQEAQRQHDAWGGYTPPAPTTTAATTDTRPSLTLVPPDEEPAGIDAGTETDADATEPVSREQEVLDRIAELEAADVPIQQSLIEIRDNELAALRQELAEIRGEIYEPPVDETLDEIVADDSLEDAPLVDDAALDDAVADDADQADTTTTGSGTLRTAPSAPSLVDQVISFLTSYWAFIAGILVVVGGLLFWFLRRGGDDDDVEDWGETVIGSLAASEVSAGTEQLGTPMQEDSIVVVEQGGRTPPVEEAPTVEVPISMGDDLTAEMPVSEPDVGDATGQFGSLEDTFSSDTAVNLDQSDPIAEADFHMAYGLYDQAADLVNGALEVEPTRQDLLTKLAEIYFVWGNRDAFVDAAQRLKNAVGNAESSDWDNIVIMGQQIAGDHELFTGVAGATKAVDLSFDEDEGGTGALDMEFGADATGNEIIDLGAESDDTGGLDFALEDTGATAMDTSSTGAQTADFNTTAEMPTVEAPTNEPTVDMPGEDATVETPTIEEQFSGLDVTGELPSISEEELGSAIESSGQASDATAEINLDELGLDVDGLADTEIADLDDLDPTGTNAALDDTGEITGRNPQLDPVSTGIYEAFDPDATGSMEGLDPAATGLTETLDADALDLEADLQPAGDGMRLAPDETGQNPLLDPVADTDSGESLLDATGKTQILSETMAVQTFADDESGDEGDATAIAPTIGDDERTLLAPMDDDDDQDFDFAKTEALPKEVFDSSGDETGEMPAVASTDVELDLDDLTAALQVGDIADIGDTVEQPLDDRTVEQPRDDATVEQPRPVVPGPAESDDTIDTLALSPDDMSDDLQDARTMTEVGTKLDLARAYVDMGDPAGARSILEEVLDEGDESQRQQAQQLLESLPA